MSRSLLHASGISLRSLIQGMPSRHLGIPSASLFATMGSRGLSSEVPLTEKRSGGWGKTPPVTMTSLVVALMAGAGLLSGVSSFKEGKMQQKAASSQGVAGKAAVGGPFVLTDMNGEPFSDQNLLGEFALLYFGFTFCPDICPDELEKVGLVVDMIEKQTQGVVKVTPVFISVDPERDTPGKVKEYVREFSPRMIGLTGDMESVKKVSKQYRVYYSKTGESKTDYLVDHSIIHYLVDPAGEFVTFFSKSNSAEQMATSIVEHARTWKESHRDSYHKGKKLA